MLRELTLIIALGACTDIDVATSEQPIAIPIGGVATNGVATNGVATNGVATNAAASDAIAYGALAKGGVVTNHDVWLGLHDPKARTFMKYLVSCALAPDQTISWTNHDGTLAETWRGALGMCPKWDVIAPDLGCRQRVSACILARNNAFGVSVMFSMRGDNNLGPIVLGPSVPAHTYVPQTMTPVRSLSGCRHPMQGPQRDCGWSIANVGRCSPGDPVSVGEGNKAQCTGVPLGVPAGDTMLRVCNGISACSAADAIASVGDACGSTAPVVDFLCPDSSLYAVMRGSEDSTVPLQPGTVEATSLYPASEDEVFRWREGAFYGDIFGAANIAPGKPQITIDAAYNVVGVPASTEWLGVAFPNMFACSSENWRFGFANIARRVCAGPDPKNAAEYTRDCAANYAGPCRKACLTNDSSPVGDKDYDDCRAGSDIYTQPITSMLAAPCDAVPGAACATVSTVPQTW